MEILLWTSIGVGCLIIGYFVTKMDSNSDQELIDDLTAELDRLRGDLANAKRVNELQEASLEHLKRDKNRSSIRKL